MRSDYGRLLCRSGIWPVDQGDIEITGAQEHDQGGRGKHPTETEPFGDDSQYCRTQRIADVAGCCEDRERCAFDCRGYPLNHIYGQGGKNDAEAESDQDAGDAERPWRRLDYYDQCAQNIQRTGDSGDHFGRKSLGQRLNRQAGENYRDGKTDIEGRVAADRLGHCIQRHESE